MFGGRGERIFFFGGGGGEIPPPHAVTPTPAETNMLKHSLFLYFSNVLATQLIAVHACEYLILAYWRSERSHNQVDYVRGHGVFFILFSLLLCSIFTSSFFSSFFMLAPSLQCSSIFLVMLHNRRSHHQHANIYTPLLKSLATGL